MIENTIRETLPPGFQRAEYLLEHGMVDMVVHRHQIRETVSRLARLLCKAPAAEKPRLHGVIQDVLADRSSLVIKHDDIPGVMRGMTMAFRVDAATLQAAQKGQAIEGDFEAAGMNFSLSNVKLGPAPATTPAAPAASPASCSRAKPSAFPAASATSPTPPSTSPSRWCATTITVSATAFGLIVAIPALIFWRFFRSRVDAYLLSMEIASERFVRHLLSLRRPASAAPAAS